MQGDLATIGTFDDYALNADGTLPETADTHYDTASLVSDHHFYNADPAGEVYGDYYENAQGYAVSKALDPTTNAVSEIVLNGYDADYNIVPVIYDDNFFNPFTLLTANDIASAENGVITFNITETIGEAFGAQIAYISGFAADTLTVTYEEDGTVTSIDFQEDYEGNDAEFTTTVNRRAIAKQVPCTYEELGIKEIEPREETASTDKLGEALKALQGHNYTMEVTILDNIEGASATGTAVCTEDGFLLTANGATAGYIQADATHIAAVEADENGKLKGVEPAEAGTLAEFLQLPKYNYLDYMFDVDSTDASGNTFILPDEGLNYEESFIIEMLPDLLVQASYSPDAGTLSVKVDEAKGEYTFSYSHTLEYYGYLYTDVEVTTVLTKVGSTELGYTIPDDYVAFSRPTSWAECDGALEIFEKYGMSENDLPFLDKEGLVWAATVSQSAYSSDRIEAIALPEGSTGEAIYTEYIALLEANGWALETGGYYDYYRKTVGSATFSISVDYDEESVTIWFEDTIYETALGKWIEDNFTDHNNYTMSATVYETAYAVDQTSYERTSETPTRSASIGTITVRSTDDAFYQETSLFGNTTKMYGVNTDAGCDFYDAGTDGIWGDATSYGGGVTNSVYSMFDVLETTGAYLPVEGDETKFTTVDGNACYAWGNIINVRFSSSSNQPEEVEFVLDETSGTLTVKVEVAHDGLYYTDDSRTTIEECVYGFELVISAVGTTTMEGLDLPATTPAA